jgi:hypothetical protein
MRVLNTLWDPGVGVAAAVAWWGRAVALTDHLRWKTFLNSSSASCQRCGAPITYVCLAGQISQPGASVVLLVLPLQCFDGVSGRQLF